MKNIYEYPKLLIFANGTKDGGGSGFETLANAQKRGLFRANIVGVVSSHLNGGVKKLADIFKIPFFHYQKSGDEVLITKQTGAEWIALSGWLKKVEGLDPRTVFNIHPARLAFGGMCGLNVHRAVLEAFKNGFIKDTAVSMHFATEKYDDKNGQFFEYDVSIYHSDTPETLQERVKFYEHIFQWTITDLVIHQQISWDGKNLTSLVVPKGYQYLPKK